MRYGVDYAFAWPDIGCITTKGYSFVLRYVWSGQSPPSKKLLQRAEADRIKAAGLDIVSNFESWEGRPLDGYNAGVADAKTAIANTVAAGGPANAVIYFSVDFYANLTELSGPITNYFKGAASILGVNRVGVYGGYRTVKYLAEKGLAKWFWQTFAWSDGLWYSRNHIEQFKNGVQLCGGDVDLNRARVSNFGQWGAGGFLMALSDAQQQDLYEKIQGIHNTVSYKSDTAEGDNFAQDRMEWDQQFENIETGVETLKQTVNSLTEIVKTLAAASGVDPEAFKALVKSAVREVMADAATEGS